MNSLHHEQSLARELRPIALTIALVLLCFALIACGSSEEGASGAEPAPAAQHVLDGAVPGAEHADAADHADHAAHADHLEDAPAHDVHANHDAHANHPGDLPAVPSDKLPGTSIYHLATNWTDHHGEAFALPELRGGPAVFVMFYGDCTTACPLLVKSAEDIDGALSDEQRASTSFVMVTFDTRRDTPERLAAYAAEKGLARENWHWLVGSPLQTRQLATLLGVQYRDVGNGMFAHSNIVTVVDGEGVPTARLEGLGIDLEPAVAAIAGFID